MIRRTIIFLSVLGVLLGSALVATSSSPSARAAILGDILFKTPAIIALPGNVVGSFNMFFGCARNYNIATRGNAVCTVCLPLDSTCAAISGNAQTGVVPNPVLAGTPCDNLTHKCTVKVYDDGTGSGFTLTQTTIASRPTLVIADQGGRLCATAPATATIPSSATLTQAQPMSFTSVVKSTSGTQPQIYFDKTSTSAEAGLGNGTTTDQLGMYAGTWVGAAASHTSWWSYQAVLNGASSIINLNGVETSGLNPGADTYSANTLMMFANSNGSAAWAGDICELGLKGSAFSSGDRAALVANQRGFYAF